MDHPPSNVVATPVIQKYNVYMDYPWIIHGSSAIQCSSYPSNSEIQCVHGLSMDHPPSNVVATPSNLFIQCIHGLSMDHPLFQCGSHPSNLLIQCIYGLSMYNPWTIRHPMY